MQANELTAIIESHHHRYLQQKQAIENRLRDEIEHFRAELSKYNPHSKCEVERWTAGVYQSLLERRTNLVRMLFAGSGACTQQV